MGIRAVLVSLALHAGVALLLGLLHQPAQLAPRPALAPLEVSVVAMPLAAVPTTPTGDAPGQPGERPAPAAPRSRGPTRPPAGAPAAPAGAPWMQMRAPGRREEETPGRGGEVSVPRPWHVGAVEGPPPRNQLPPGALGGPARAPRPFVPGPNDEARRLGHGVVADGDGGYKEHRPAYTTRIDRDGTIRFKDKAPVGIDRVGGLPTGFGIAGWFDVTDALLRALGDDPYAYEKMRIMEGTREVRAGMARRERSARIRDAVGDLSRYLEAIWGQARHTPAEKRRILFALWEEVAEEGDAEVVRAGEMARATIEAFVRRRLPVGSELAYSAAELAELNRRRKSRAAFDPYAR